MSIESKSVAGINLEI